MVCAYCGGFEECKDHIICGVRSNGRRIGKTKNVKASGTTVPSCLLCNSALSDYPYSTIKDRRDFLLKKYFHWRRYNTRKLHKHGWNEILRKIKYLEDRQ